MEFAVRTAGTVHFATVQCILYSLEISARLGNSGWLPRKTCAWVFPPSYAMCWVVYTDCTGCSPLTQSGWLPRKHALECSHPPMLCAEYCTLTVQAAARLDKNGCLPRKTCTLVFPPSHATHWVLCTAHNILYRLQLAQRKTYGCQGKHAWSRKYRYIHTLYPYSHVCMQHTT